MQQLDAKDLQLLVLLERDGRLSKSALALEVGLSPSACLERLRALEASKLIVSYNARIDVKLISPHDIFFTEIHLGAHKSVDFARFESYVRQAPAVIECFAVGGKFDYIMKSVFRDVTAYQDFIDELLDREIGIAQYFTFICTKIIKSSSWTPLQSLIAPDLC